MSRLDLFNDLHSVPEDRSLRKPKLSKEALAQQILEGTEKLTSYQLGDAIGAGAFGTVVRAFHVPTERFVALKMINKTKVSENERARILGEAEILRGLEHPNIIGFYDAFETSAKIYISMELGHGGELLRQLSKRGSISEAEASQLMQTLLDAVAYLHAQRVCHRDLKPENILLADENDLTSVKIADFGLSNQSEEGEDHHMRHTAGTPLFMAPELFEEEPFYSTAVDVWSCGVICYMLCCGHHPFKKPGMSDVEFKSAVKNADMRGFPSGLSNECRDFISRLLRVDPGHRYVATEALQHPWITNKVNTEPIRTVMELMRSYLAERRLKRAVRTVIVSNFLSGTVLGLRQLTRDYFVDTAVEERRVGSIAIQRRWRGVSARKRVARLIKARERARAQEAANAAKESSPAARRATERQAERQAAENRMAMSPRRSHRRTMSRQYQRLERTLSRSKSDMYLTATPGSGPEGSEDGAGGATPPASSSGYRSYSGRASAAGRLSRTPSFRRRTERHSGGREEEEKPFCAWEGAITGLSGWKVAELSAALHRYQRFQDMRSAQPVLTKIQFARVFAVATADDAFDCIEQRGRVDAAYAFTIATYLAIDTFENKLRMLFKLFDFDNSHKISMVELTMMLDLGEKVLTKVVGLEPVQSSETEGAAERCFRAMDADGSDDVSWNELRNWAFEPEEEEVEEGEDAASATAVQPKFTRFFSMMKDSSLEEIRKRQAVVKAAAAAAAAEAAAEAEANAPKRRAVSPSTPPAPGSRLVRNSPSSKSFRSSLSATQMRERQLEESRSSRSLNAAQMAQSPPLLALSVPGGQGVSPVSPRNLPPLALPQGITPKGSLRSGRGSDASSASAEELLSPR